ncbi:uncharacterized protein BJX67DRAFT_13586 [Aspergillus lucknowensis]|uniref:Transcription factor hoxa13 n=1 Tax=Aspergillus lucknowensis TaxID=176173 RepID=A0ABR4M7M0_9EURO
MVSSNHGKVFDSGDRLIATPEQRSQRKRTSRIRWTVGLLVRLCIWYFILTPFFRCPSRIPDLTESSPRICKPYLVAKSYVEPHVVPYYNTYGAPYVDAARPYVTVLNEKVYTPVSNIAKQGYDAYGAPAMHRAQAYGQQQWDANVVPHIETAKSKVNDWYRAQVAPHVQQLTAAVSPYYRKVYGVYWATLDGYVLPFAARYRPFIGKTYTSGQDILATTVLPYAQSTWSSTVYIVNNSIWPKVSSLYSENVEPQLVKIGQRLASYREGKRLQSVMDEVESSAGYATSSLSQSDETGKTGSQSTSPTSATASQSLSPAELAAQAREKIASDLLTWKERFASASEKGIEGLEGRVVEIVETFLASGTQTNGEGLLRALESAVDEETATIRRRTNLLAESLPFQEAPEEEGSAVDELLKEVRNSAVSIRDRAHVLREWHISFEQDLIGRVSIAVNATLEVLDNVRDLGLQEIGMRWAWMDGVTYKDWEDYHALKAEFEDWKEKFREIGLKHARIEAARETADDILSRGMDVAEAAAKELARLKDVGRWKIAAREASEDFDTRSEPPPPLPKPTVAADDVPSVSDEEEQTRSDAEEPVDENNTKTDSEGAELNDERPEIPLDGETILESTTESTDFSSEGLTTDSETTAETKEPEDDVKSIPHAAAFGAEAAPVAAPDDAAVGDDREDISQDEFVDAEATKLSDTVSQSLGIEEVLPKSSQEPTQDKAVEDLLSKLLADKDAEFAEEVLKKLQAMYETPEPSAAHTASETVDVDAPASTSSVSVIDDERDNVYSILPVPEPGVAGVPDELETADNTPEPVISDDESEELESIASSFTPEVLEPEPTEAADASEDQSSRDDL